MIDPNVGEMVGHMRYGNVVEFWFRSRSGGQSDTVQIAVPFPTEALAIAVAAMTTPDGIATALQAEIDRVIANTNTRVTLDLL